MPCTRIDVFDTECGSYYVWDISKYVTASGILKLRDKN